MGQALNTWHEVPPPSYAPLDRYGLFSVAQMRTDSLTDGQVDPHWRVGIEWVSPACGYAYSSVGPCPEDALYGDNYCVERQFDPFTVYTYKNRAPGLPGWTLEQIQQLALQDFQLNEEREVEYNLLNIMRAESNHPTGCVDFAAYRGWVGLGQIEEYMGWTTASQFVLHMDRGTAVALSLHLKADGGVLRTITGTPVVVGSGYANTWLGPQPYSYVYATGPVVAYRGDIVTTPVDVVDQNRNRPSIIVQRDYAVGYDCGAYCFRIALDEPVTSL